MGGQIFANEVAEDLFNLICSINESIMNDMTQASLHIHQFKSGGEGSLINFCNSIFEMKPFIDPPEPFCETFEDMVAYALFKLNTMHCFVDGNKRTTLMTIMYLIGDSENYSHFNNNFFRGALAVYLVDMLDERSTEEEVKKWVYKQFKSTMVMP